MRRGVLPVLCAALLAGGCGGGSSGPDAAVATQARQDAPREQQEGGFRQAAAEIEKRDGETVTLTVELAETLDQRSMGLMGRESLPPDHGMLFVFPGPSEAGFWMKNTLIPLSIAFIGEGGRIVAILDMEPCEAEPCPVYEPGTTYRTALEVEQGAFARWGVREGDTFRLSD